MHWNVIGFIILNLTASFQVVGHSISKRSTITRLTVSVGGSIYLPCPVNYPYGTPVEFVLRWLKDDYYSVPIFTASESFMFTNIDFKHRLHFFPPSSINITHIQQSDDGIYECDLRFLDGAPDSRDNNTRYRLAVMVAPSITISSQHMYVNLSQTVTISCIVTGTPAPETVWEKNGKTLQDNVRFTVNGGSLEINNFEREDAGVYTCKAWNAIGEVEKNIHVMLADGPHMVNPPSNATRDEGTDVRLPCEAGGFPNNITYRWFKNNLDVMLVEGLKGRVEIFAEGTLQIKPSQKEDSGWYRCRATNGIGSAKERQCYLNIIYKAYVTGQIPREFLPRGLTDRIPCNAVGNPPVYKVVWQKGDRVLDTSSRKYKILGDWSLQISNITDTDEGFYKCIPHSELGQGNTEHNVQVSIRDPPHFAVRPNKIYQREMGETITFPCVAKGDPSPSIKWRKIGSDIPSTATYNGGNLTITRLSKAEHGRYECIARNLVTTVITTTRLIIERTTPHAPENLTVTTDQFSAHVEWEPGWHGGLKQVYVLWFRKEGSEWTTLKVMPEGATEYSVYGLQPDTDYWFSVLSRNSMGDSLHSSEVKVGTKGYDPNMSMVLPKNGEGNPYCPTLVKSAGDRPFPPMDLSVSWKSDEVVRLSWNPPKNSSVPALCYRVEYKETNGEWQELARTLDNFYDYKPMSGKSYEFRVRSYNVMSFSEAYSSTVPLNNAAGIYLSEPAIWGISAACIAVIVVLIIAVVFLVKIKRKKRREKRVKYSNVNNVKYIDSNHTMQSAPLTMKPQEDEPDSGGFGLTQAQRNRIFVVEDSYRQWYKNNSLSPNKPAQPQSKNFFEHSIKQYEPEKSWRVRKSPQAQNNPVRIDYSHPVSRIARAPDGRFVEADDTSDDVFLYPEHNVNEPIEDPSVRFRGHASPYTSYYNQGIPNTNYDNQGYSPYVNFPRDPYENYQPQHSMSFDNDPYHLHQTPAHPGGLNTSYPQAYPEELGVGNLHPEQYPIHDYYPESYQYHNDYPVSHPYSDNYPERFPTSYRKPYSAPRQEFPPHSLHPSQHWQGHPADNPHIPLDSFYSTESGDFTTPMRSDPRAQIPRQSSLKPSQQTYLNDEELQRPFTSDISSVYPSSAERASWNPEPHQRPSPPYLDMSSIPPYSRFHENGPVRTSSQDMLADNTQFSDNHGRAAPLREDSPGRKIARVPPSPKKNDDSDNSGGGTKPLAYTRDQLQGAVEKVRRGPRSRRQLRNQALANSFTDGDSFGTSEPDSSAHDPDHGAMPNVYSSNMLPYKDIPANRVSVTSGSSGRGSSTGHLNKPAPLSTYTHPTASLGYMPRSHSDVHSGKAEHSPDSYSSGIGSRNTSRSTSGHMNSASQSSSGTTPYEQDLSTDSYPYSDVKHKRDISGDENYEFDAEPLGSELLDALRTYNQHSGAGRRRSRESDSHASSVHEPHSANSSRLDTTEDAERFARLREEYQQYRRNQDFLRYKTNPGGQRRYELESELL